MDNGGASAGATSDAKGEHKKVAAPPKADKKESPVSPRKRKVPAAKKAPEVTRRVSRRLQAKNGENESQGLPAIALEGDGVDVCIYE